MIQIDGYTIEHFPKQNRIIIGLPQTMSTATSTVMPIAERRQSISTHELSAILALTKTCFEKIK